MPQQRSNVIAIGTAIHTLVEAALKKGAPVSNRRRRTPAEEEALRLRTESAARERMDFGKKTSKGVTDESPFYMAGEEALTDRVVGDNRSDPSIIDQLQGAGSSLTGYSIMEEIHEARMMGKLRPFVEGEPIGVCHNGPKPGPAPMLKTQAEIMEDHREELRARQKRNDRSLARMKEKNRRRP